MKGKASITVAVLLVLALYFTGFIYAGGIQSTSPATSQGPIAIEIFEGISVILPSPAQDPILQGLQSKLGITLNMNTTLGGNDYRNQLNIRIAGNDMPDVAWMINRTDLVKNAKDGTILELTPYLSRLGQVTSYLGADYMAAGLVDGKLFAICKAPNIPYSTYIIRKDWLDALNLKVPQTMQEFKDTAVKFANEDPDHNGVKDTIGISGGTWNAFQYIFGGYGIGAPGQYYVKNNTLINALFEPDMPVALGEIKALIDTGCVDPELFTVTDSNLRLEKAWQGKIGILYDQWVNVSKNIGPIKEVNPNANWIQIAIPQGPKGNYDSSASYYTSGLLSFGAHLAKDEAKLNKVIDLFNYVASPEGLRLVSYGIEGVHYNVENGKIVTTPRRTAEGGYFWAYQFVGRDEMEYLPTSFVGWDNEIKFANDQPRLRNLEAFFLPPDGYNKADMDRYISDELVKFIYGRRPIAEYPQFLNELETMFKDSVYMQTYVEQAKSFGFIK
ncbi:MAG: extracellular solute-binding protein [Treponema sp.]|nr:extracellular solute-binding protein [Treponema sp.]